MTTLRNIILGLLLILVACKQPGANNYDKLILGDWTLVKEEPKTQKDADGNIILEPPPVWRATVGGYRFLPDSICENKPGYFKRIKEGETLFLGTATKYKIETDTLKIYDLSDGTWNATKIYSIKSDTLTLRTNDGKLAKYSKAHYNVDNNDLFDQIIVSSSGCFGPCEINNTSISKDGQVIYFGDEYNTINGYFKSRISNTAFAEIETNFKKADINALENSYEAGWTDDQTITVTFIKDSKIVKTISDYGRQSPTEFYWAYTPVRYLHQQIPLDTLSSIPIQYKFYHSFFEYNGQVCDLTQSEGFYLWSLLINSAKTQRSFTKKYSLEAFGRGEGISIVTDGQYFKFELGGVSETYDLGFNFITHNNLTKKFRPKSEFD